jgi:hypothetical protein
MEFNIINVSNIYINMNNKEKNIYFLCVNKELLIKNEAIEEFIRERNNYYIIENKKVNFWISNNSTFLLNNYIFFILQNTEFYKFICKKLNKKLIFSDFSFIFSTDKKFIEWVNLRLGYLENLGKFSVFKVLKFKFETFFLWQL